MNLKKYQENAVSQLLKCSVRLLNLKNNGVIVFQSPTGSGKTIMMAEFLIRLCSEENFEEKLSFIWVAPRELHKQSKTKLSHYCKDSRDVECLEFEELNDRKIGFSEILFFNWESITKKDNLYIRDNEKNNNLSHVLERTREEGRRIVLIVDESHHGLDAPASRQVTKDIGPNLMVRVSATPVRQDCQLVKVEMEEVRQEGMIKQGISLNKGFTNNPKGDSIFSDSALSSREIVLRESLLKREYLKSLYKKRGLDTNPLLLVQLPDRRTGGNDGLDRVVEIMDRDHDITKDNGRLGIWTAKEKVNIESIEKKDSPVDVLIFKQAIALGWDCPRSHILALFRDWSSHIFSIQTVGRIMRVASIDEGIYPFNYDDLNYAYVYTNLPEIKLDDELIKSYMAIFKSRRRGIYKDLRIHSWHRIRRREKTRLSPVFLEVFKKEADFFNLKGKININKKNVKGKSIEERKVKDIEDLREVKGRDVEILNDKELEIRFKKFISDTLQEEPYFSQEVRSINNFKMAIYKFFSKNFEIDFLDRYTDIVCISLDESNGVHFKEVAKRAKESYLKEIEKRDKELSEDIWEVPIEVQYNQHYQKREVGKSIMSPFYEKINSSNMEKDFVSFLDNQEKVEWWFKNGEKNASFFAISYKENNKEKLFYVDFLVKFKDGRIGFFDTKGTRGHGGASESEEKVKALKRYADYQGKNFFGGVVTDDDGWKIYDEKGQKYNVKDSKNWKPLIF